MIPARTVPPLATFLLGLGASGCGSDVPEGAAPPDLEATVLAMTDEAVLPAAEGFATATGALRDSVDTLCQAPDGAAVDAARDRWREASRRWYRFTIYDFGPMSEGVTPADAFIDSFKAFRQGTSYLETIRGDLRTLVAEGQDLTGEDLSQWNFQRVGLLALEVGLFETATEPPDPAAAAVAAELVAQPNKCTYLTKQASLLADRADALYDAWRPEGGDYRGTFLSSTNDALGAALSSAAGQLEYLERRSIATVAAPVSGASFANVGATTDELEALLGAGGTDSLRTRLEEAQAQGLLREHDDRVATARDAIATEDAEILEPELAALEVIYREGMPQALGIELGLNFTDGD